MKGELLIFIFIILTVDITKAQSQYTKWQVTANTGYEQVSLHWSIAGNQNGQNPNVYSELKWNRLSGPAINTSSQLNIWKQFYLTAGYSNLCIRSGTVSDHDYNGDNRTNPVYGDTFAANRGFINQWTAGIGYSLLHKDAVHLMPVVGYTEQRQHLYLLDNSRSSGLRSTYNPVWKGVFVKSIASVRLSRSLQAGISVAYAQLQYSATADWNLIQTFQHPVSYRHRAKGYAVNTAVAFAYHINKRFAVQTAAAYDARETGNGTDDLYLAAGGIDRTQLNGVKSYCFGLTGGVLIKL